MKHTSMTPANAEAVAAQALLFLSAESDRLERFMALSGIDLDTLRSSASSPATLAGVLEYVLSDESLVLGLAEFAEFPPDVPAAALRALGGTVEF